MTSFGVTYRDDNTDTSESQTFRMAANDSRTWHGWTRTSGLQFLTGDFTVAQQKGNTTLLYPEISLSKKHADDFNFPRKGWSMTLVGRAAQEGVLADTSFAQIGADAKWIHGLGEHGHPLACVGQCGHGRDVVGRPVSDDAQRRRQPRDRRYAGSHLPLERQRQLVRIRTPRHGVQHGSAGRRDRLVLGHGSDAHGTAFSRSDGRSAPTCW